MIRWRFKEYETLPSTSDLCRIRAEAGEVEGLVILARRQIAGRGSRGRSWKSGSGNLAFSFLLTLPKEAAFLRVLPFAVAIALYEAILACLKSSLSEKMDLLQLKWPNDVLLCGRKMAGILIETGEDNGRRWAVVGVGANLQQAPIVEGRALAALSEVVVPPDSAVLARAVLTAFNEWWRCWQEEGEVTLYRAWQARAHPVGIRLAVKGHGTYMSGTFEGLDRQGRLLLGCDNGRIVPVVTGDILCV